MREKREREGWYGVKRTYDVNTAVGEHHDAMAIFLALTEHPLVSCPVSIGEAAHTMTLVVPPRTFIPHPHLILLLITP